MKTVFLILCSLIIANPIVSQDKESIVIEVKEELKLDENQTDQFSSLIENFASELNAVVEKHETEETDPKVFLEDVKAVREQYREDLADILTEEQMNAYQTYVDKIFDEIIGDIVEIKLLDLKPVLELKDEQITQLRPVLTKSVHGVLSTIYEYADKRMGIRNKLKIGKTLKRIQADARTEIEKILTTDQLQTWDEFKEKQKSSK